MDQALRSSLEYGTKLDTPRGAHWLLKLYPDAAEAGGSFHSSIDPRPGSPGPSPTPELNQLDAGRRARGKLRRYCAANRLNRLATLSYAGAGCHDHRELRGDLGEFFRRLRRDVGEPFPYAWVPEWHKTDHGLHAHFAVGRFIHYGRIRAAWGHGFVHIKLLGDLPVGSTALHEARLASRYLAKYVVKDLTHEHPIGFHRYEVAQGFQPRAVEIAGRSGDEVLDRASHRMGSEPEYVWRSSDTETYVGPPAVWASWR